MRKPMLLIGFALLFLGVSAASAQAKKIGMKRAKQIAVQEVQGKIKSSELEEEHGKWIYSFDILSKEGKIKEVQVDAFTGAVISVEEEDAAKEAAEKEQEKAEKHEKKKN